MEPVIESTETPLPSYVDEFRHLFEKQNFKKLPKKRKWDHEINLMKNAPSELGGKVYPMTHREMEELDKVLDEGLATGKIRPSKSPYASATFFMDKAGSSEKRMIQDYWELNKYTIKDKFPLPRVSELLDVLQGAKYFNKMDIIWGYNNVRIKEGDEWKAAFITPRGLFEPLVMSFGFCNALGTFCRMMADNFQDLIRRKVCVTYVDDVYAIGKDLDELRRNTIECLKVFDEHELYIKQKKCAWEVTKCDILGYIVGDGKVEMAPSKVEAITDWKTPQDKKEVQKFLGFCNFYRRFVQDYSRITKPLTGLTGNNLFKWGPAEQGAFTELKKAITSAPVLALPTETDKFRVETDASDYAIGAVLSQQQDGKWKPVAFLSRTMTSPEQNYKIYNQGAASHCRSTQEMATILDGSLSNLQGAD